MMLKKYWLKFANQMAKKQRKKEKEKKKQEEKAKKQSESKKNKEEKSEDEQGEGDGCHQDLVDDELLPVKHGYSP